MKKLILFILCPISAFLIEIRPWFGNIYEFSLFSTYFYSYYSKFDSSLTPFGSSNDHLLYFDLEFPLSKFSFDTDLQFINTPRESFCFSSTALQGRYLLADDVIGDFLSVVVGSNVRFTANKSLHDISVPYHGPVAFEGTIALGKELSQRELWILRSWLFGAVGIANKGSPWVRALFSIEGNVQEIFKVGIYLIGYHGYGRKTVVDIENFNGYGSIRDKSIDLAVRVGRTLGTFGTLSFEYMHRFYAKRCPEDVNSFAISYFLPFSF